MSLRRGLSPTGELRGAALVIVLSFLIIITGLVVAFLSSVTNEATATTAAAAGVTTRGLADSVVQLTIAQIRDATAGFDRAVNGSLDTTRPTGWASQPGAIRVFTTSFNGGTGGGGGGNASFIYKLYSATNLVDSSGGAPSNDLPASGWSAKTALYTDLNAPVRKADPSGIITTNYPIMDPALAMTNPLTGSANATNVDGFSIDTTAPCYTSSNPAAMPVVWLYMLKDGTLIAPDASSTATATFNSASVRPSSNNPIVGRIAFWTDDETCKLNINTASEGMPWDPPTFNSPEETGYMNYAPGQHEYNRFLGHPFSVSLSPVLWSYFGFQHPAQLVWSTPPNWRNFTSTNTIFVWQDLPPVPSPLVANLFNPTNYLTALFGVSNVANGILPRTAPGTNGSLFGSFRTVDTNNRATFTNFPPRTDRLYASVDEMNFLVTNGLLAGRTNNSPVFSPRDIARLRFFLTAQSRAPEVNILNLPRICLWPLNDTNVASANTVNPYLAVLSGTARWSFLDKMIAQCATLGTNAYYFTRYDPLDPFKDAAIPRNQILYNYLTTLLQTPLPGFASSSGTPSSFATRWGSNACYETATLCFDYIRSSINLIDSYGSTNGPGGTDATDPAQRYAYSYTAPPTNFLATSNSEGVLADNANANNAPGKILPPGSGQVVPIIITTNGVSTRGMGRFPVIKSVNLVFCAVAADQPPLMISNTGATPRAPIVPWQTNPLHPYPFGYNFQTNGGWDFPVDGTFTFTRTNSDTGTPYTATRNNINIVTTNTSTTQYQFPSLYPASNTASNQTIAPFSLMSLTAGARSWSASIYSNNWATNILVLYYTNASTATTNTGTNSYQFLTTNGITGLSNAHALTITHAGLVYGGDLDTNNPVGSNYGFDAYNIYFSNIATSLGIATTAINVPYINQIIVSNRVIPPPATNFFTTNTANISTLTIPNTNSPLFPQPYQTVMQPVLLINHGLTTPGFPSYTPNFKIRVRGLGNLTADGSNCFASGDYGQYYTNSAPGVGQWGAGYPDIGPDLFGISLSGNGSNNMTNGIAANVWPFVGNFVKTTNIWNASAGTGNGRTFAFGGGTITIEYLKPTASYTTTSTNDILQTVSIVFPTTRFPTPKLPPFNGAATELYNYPPWFIGFGTNTNYSGASYAINTNPINFIHPRYLLPSNSLPPNTNNMLGRFVNGAPMNMGWFFLNDQWWNQTTANTLPASNASCFTTANTIRAVEVGYGDWRLPAMMRTIGPGSTNYTPSVNGYGYTLPSMTNLYIPHVLYFASNAETAAGLGAVNPVNNTNFFWRAAHSIRGQGLAFTLTGIYDNHAGNNNSSVIGSFWQSFNNAVTNGNDPGLSAPAFPLPVPNNAAGKLFAHTRQPAYANSGAWPEALSTVDFAGYVTNATAANLFANVWTNGGDFDNPVGGAIVDGPYINKADEGSVGWTQVTGVSGNWGAGSPYGGPFPPWASLGRARFSPNRQVPSSGILGSLPAGFDPSNPSLTNAWRSLVFCANPYSSNRVASMPNPPDYMIMDLFDMPVVQPYPISDPFSTAGRVNLNYQIAPFSHIHRDSALRGVLKSVDMAAVPDSAMAQYKNGYRQYTPQTTNIPNNYYSYYYPIHLNETLKKFDAKFATNGFFRAGAEICSMWLYPALSPNNGTAASSLSSTYLTNPATPVVSDASNSLTNIRNWWYANSGTTRKGLTGANVRARPYAGIYPNITTKSNTYQIHYRVQTLKQTPTAHSSDWSTWIDPSNSGFTDRIIGEQRGSTMVERYIDPSDPSIPDFAANFVASGGGNAASVGGTSTMDAYYRFRIFNAETFTP